MPESSSDRHHQIAADRGPIPVAVVTVSDSRTPESDTNAHYLREAIAAAGHRVVEYRLLRDEPAQIAAALDELTAGEARIILFNGGTGISTRDSTFDALDARLEKRLPGFGELFRCFLWAGRRGGDAFPGHGGYLPWACGHLRAWLPGRGAACLGEAARLGAGAPCLGDCTMKCMGATEPRGGRAGHKQAGFLPQPQRIEMRSVTPLARWVAAGAVLSALAACGPAQVAPAPAPATPATALTPLAQDVHSYARPNQARVTHVDLDLRADFAAKQLAGTAALDLAVAPGAR